MAADKHIFYIDSKRNTVIIPVGEILKDICFTYTCTFEFDENIKEHLAKHLVINGCTLNAIDKGGYYESKQQSITSNLQSFSIQNIKPSIINPLPITDNVYSAMIVISMQEAWIKDVVLHFKIYNKNKSKNLECDVVLKTDVSNNRIFEKTGNVINNNSNSFMLVRTNPKMTGNIKLVVDTDYQLYLDTFKVSEVLSNNKYRHQPISSDGNYPRDVKHIFGSLPQQEMYRVDGNAYDIHKCYVDYNMQYETMYEYGAETNSDFLYKENMRILAPLKIGRDIPDFFCIFRVEKNCNEESYDSRLNDTEVFRKMLAEGSCVQVYDLRKHTSIGQYLHNYLDMIRDINGSLFLQFVEQDQDKNSNNYQQKFRTGNNRWYGISVDKGVLTSKIETSYNANKILNESDSKQEDFDQFLLRGFERNNLLCHDIINLEFMFNDENSDNFKIYNYFGLYLKGNEFLEYGHIINDYTKDGKHIEQRYGINGELIDDKLYFTGIIDNENYADRIIMAVTPKYSKHIKTGSELDDFLYEYVVNKPNENIIISNAKELDLENKPFVCIKFKHQVNYGEHFRVCDEKNKRIYEVIASNDHRLANTKNYCHPYISKNTKSGYEIYRLSFYVADLEDENALADLDEQISRISYAFSRFDNMFYISSKSNNSLAIVYCGDEKHIKFEHITADINNPKLLEDGSVEESLYYFTDKKSICAYPLNIDYEEKSIFGMHDFGLMNVRYHSIVEFLTYDKLYVYTLWDDISNVSGLGKDVMANTTKGYRRLEDFSIVYEHTTNDAIVSDTLKINHIISPYNVNCSAVCSDYPVVLLGNRMLIYNYMQCDVCLMGIYNIKDLDMRIDYDSTKTYKIDSSIEYESGTNIEFGFGKDMLRYNEIYRLSKGTVNISGIVEGSTFYAAENDGACSIYFVDSTGNLKNTNISRMVCDSDVAIDVLDYPYCEYEVDAQAPLHKFDNLFADKTNKTTSKLNTPLCPQVSCFWNSVGTYYDKVNVLDVSDVINKEYMKQITINNSDLIGYSDTVQYKGGKETKGFIGYSLNNKVYTGSGYSKFIDLIVNESNVHNPIRQYLYNNGDPEFTKGYYNKYIDTFEFIYNGIKFTLKFTSKDYNIAVRLSEYNNFDVCVLNDYNEGLSNEIYVSIPEELILIINHKYNGKKDLYNNQHAIIKNNNLAFDNSLVWYMLQHPLDFSKAYGDAINIFLPKTGPLNVSTSVNWIVQHDYLKSNFDGFQEGDNYCCIILNDGNMTDCDDCLLLSGNNNDWYKNMFTCTQINSPENMKLELDMKGKKKDLELHTYILTDDYSPSTSDNSYNVLDALQNSFNNEFVFNVIDHDNNVYTINNTDSYSPLSITKSKPSYIKYNYGYFEPKFYDVIGFAGDEDVELQELCNNSFLLNNTKFNYLGSINNYYCNKVFDNVKDKKIKNNFFVLSDKSLVSTVWDAGIYRKYTDEEGYSLVDGYIPGIEDKMLFGSTCLVINNAKINITRWDYDSNNSVVKVSQDMSKFNTQSSHGIQYVIEFNLTKALYNYIMNSEEFADFINQWSKFGTNASTSIHNYINNTISQKYFKLTDKNNFKLYKNSAGRNNDVLDLVLGMPEDFDSWTETTNFDSEYRNENNEIILKIRLKEYANASYYPTFLITR